MPSYDDLISGRSRSPRSARRARRPARPRSGRARQRGPRANGSATASCWSPAPAARSAPSCAARSRASGRRGWCCSTSPRSRSTRSRRRWPTPSRSCRSSAVVGDVQARGAGRGGARARAAERRLPRRRLQARAADGGDQRVGGGAQQRLRHLGAGARGGRGEGREVRARLDRQGGQSDQRDGRDKAPGRDGRARACKAAARSS